MRRSLRTQILLPVLGVVLAAMVCVSIANAWLAARRTRANIEVQLRGVARTLAESNFPLTDAVLRQTQGLSGAEFVVVDAQGKVVATSLARVDPLPAAQAVQSPQALELDEIVSLGNAAYFRAVVRRKGRPGTDGDEWLHILYPEKYWRRAWREAVAPPFLIGGVSLILTTVLATWIAARWTRPMERLRSQVEQIAHGDFRPLPLPERDDEIRDLAASVNRMAEMLARYEGEVRRRERLRTLGQLGGGIAHQMRNAATGCRMALDLHRRQRSDANDDENLSVAVRQLELMETYLRRFLTLGAEHNAPSATIDIGRVVENVLPLLRPTAAHLGVALCWTPPKSAIFVRGDENGLAQLVVNLTLNAIEAASGSAHVSLEEDTPGGNDDSKVVGTDQADRSAQPPTVEVHIVSGNDGFARLEIVDTGPGPAADVRDQIFEPLVSDKRDGAGLGLPVAREIAQLHGGDISWERRQGKTYFVVKLPILKGESPRGASVNH